MNFNRKNQIISLVVNAVIFISVLILGVYGILYGAGSGQVGDDMVGVGYLKAYTIESNFFAAVCAGIFIIFNFKNLRTGDDATPKWALILHLMSSACLFLTMMVAALFLGPMKAMMGEGYLSMFSNDMFFFHLVNPVLSIYSIICLQGKYRFQKRDGLIAMIPTIIYSFVYLVMVAILKVWSDFYGFTFGGRYYLIPLVFVVIYSVVYGLSRVMMFVHNKKIGEIE